ncbi:ATP-dependent nuclease [Glacieibacterium frigidum]|uniref:AAA family ATPase n=1 Tax=Glacieibacterium frigidum TaxID=2593303 RepID=A0A552UHM9_9SPHN|nr:ATP-binding protein [Glacieibacterium frigidum]TRW17728.1 AAA family ATPase [Glacieibacterium frigidum]
MPRAPTDKATAIVLLARSLEAARTVEGRPLLAIIPDEDNFNDYNMRHYAYLYLLAEDGEETRVNLRIMFVGSSNAKDYIKSVVSAESPIYPIEQVEVPFCSLQGEAMQYRQLVEGIGFDNAVFALRAMHDVVLANLEQEDDEVIALTLAEDFHVGVVRSATRYTAYRRGGQYLRPKPRDAVDDAAATFPVKAPLPGSPEPVTVDFDFEPDPIFDDRACVLIGRNGVGKTQLLRSIVEGLTDEGAREDVTSADIGKSARFTRTIVFSSVPSDPYRKSIPPWFDIDYEYFAVAADPHPLGRAFLQSLLDALRDDGSAFGADGTLRTRAQLLEVSLEQLGMWKRLYVPLRPKTRAAAFRSHIEVDGIAYVALHERYNERQKNQLASFIDMSGTAVVLSDRMEPRRLSSGELAMIQFAAQAAASVENGSLLLFDEPETHLHPNYVSQFMDLLQELLARSRSVAIIATHSAYVLREVPRQRVTVLSRDEDGTILADRPRMQTFGANIDDLSQFVFIDSAVSARYRERLETWGKTEGREIGIDGIIERYGNQLSSTTLSIVAHAIRADQF